MATILLPKGRMTRPLTTPYSVGDRVTSLVNENQRHGRVRIGEGGAIARVIISDPGDGDATFPMFYVRARRGTVLLHATEFVPAAEAEAHLALEG